MAGRRRTIDRKAQRTDYDEEGAPKAEDEEAEDEEEEEDEDEDEGEEGEADADAVDADDDSGDDDDDGGDDDDDEDAPKKKKKKVAKPKKAAAPKRARATKKAVRQKAVWVVLDNSSKQVETFPYAEKAEAEKYVAARLAVSGSLSASYPRQSAGAGSSAGSRRSCTRSARCSAS